MLHTCWCTSSHAHRSLRFYRQLKTTHKSRGSSALAGAARLVLRRHCHLEVANNAKGKLTEARQWGKSKEESGNSARFRPGTHILIRCGYCIRSVLLRHWAFDGILLNHFSSRYTVRPRALYLRSYRGGSVCALNGDPQRAPPCRLGGSRPLWSEVSFWYECGFQPTWK